MIRMGIISSSQIQNWEKDVSLRTFLLPSLLPSLNVGRSSFATARAGDVWKGGGSL